MNLCSKLLAASVALSACGGLDGEPEPALPVAGESLPAGSEWDESLAAAARPCGDHQPATCAAATGGACGVAVLPVGSLCVPRFDWQRISPLPVARRPSPVPSPPLSWRRRGRAG